MNGAIALSLSTNPRRRLHRHWLLVWVVDSASYGHSTPLITVDAATRYTSHHRLQNECHPFHCSIPTPNHDETTKHDGRALNNI